jgi:hypothetical protein
MKVALSFFVCLLLSYASVAQEKPLQIALLKYNGGGDLVCEPNISTQFDKILQSNNAHEY